MKREEIEKILTEELGTMYPIEKHIAIIDRLLSLHPQECYIEVKPEDELPGIGDGYKTLSDDVFAILMSGEVVTAYYDHINKTWAGMFNAKDTVKFWLKKVTLPVSQDAEERYERAMIVATDISRTWGGAVISEMKKIARIAAGLKEEV